MIKKGPRAAQRKRGGAPKKGALSIFGFSLFGRKPAPAPALKPTKHRTALAPRLSTVEATSHLRALQTTEKIDRIESEMAHSLARASVAAPSTVRAPAARSAAVAAGNTQTGVPTQPDPFLGVSTDAFFDNAAAIEITQPSVDPVLEGAAIAFANGGIADAAAQLRGSIDGGALADADSIGWRMLFELHMVSDDRPGFDAEAQGYSARFGRPAPTWRSYAPIVAVAPPPAASVDPAAGAIRLPVALDAGLVEPLTALKAQAARLRDLAIDCGSARSIDGTGAELLLRVLAAIRGSAYRLRLAGIDGLLAATRRAAVPGRREVPQAIWALRLEALRIAGKQAEYEDVAMQYCVTYEVSPPAWEPPPANIELGAAATVTPIAAPALVVPPAVEVLGAGHVAWRGHLEGAGDAAFAALLGQVPAHRLLTVDCLDLRRLAYDAGAALLGHLVALQASGASVVFADVNPCVHELMTVLGIGAVAEVRVRPA